MLVMLGEYYELKGTGVVAQLTTVPHKWWVKYIPFINYNELYIFKSNEKQWFLSESALVQYINDGELKHVV